MKIALISPGSPASVDYQPPLGLGYLLSALKASGFPDTHYIEFQGSTEAALRRRLRELSPDVVGINCVTPTRHRSLRLAEIARQERPEATIVFGGVHATFLASQLLEHYPTQVDVVVRGEGERAFVELLERLRDGDPLDGVDGVSFRRDNGEIVETPKRAFIEDLDALPFPEYIEHTAHVDGGRFKAGVLMTARGCPGACNYCSVPRFWGRPRLRRPEAVVEEMDWLTEEHGVRYIRIMDDTFSLDIDRAVAICEGILQRGLQFGWRCATRVDCVTPELLELMARAGCVRVSLGIESGSPAILETIRKRIGPEQAVDACRWAHEAGIKTETNFMVGNIGESRESIEETKALVRRIAPEEFNVSNAVYMFPGTPLYRYGVRQGLIDDSVWLRPDPVFPYLAEHSRQRLSAWQMEILRECGASRGLVNYMLYAMRIARTLPPRQLVRAGYHFLRANLLPKRREKSS